MTNNILGQILLLFVIVSCSVALAVAFMAKRNRNLRGFEVKPITGEAPVIREKEVSTDE